LWIGKRHQHGGAGDRGIEQRSFLPLKFSRRADAYAGRIEAAARVIGKKRILPMKLWELLFGHAADKHNGQHPLPRFVRAQYVDHVAAVVAQTQRHETQHGLGRAPEGFERNLNRRIERERGFVQRCVEPFERGGLAAPHRHQIAIRDIGRSNRRAEQVAQGGEAPCPVLRRQDERKPLFERAHFFDQRQQLFGASLDREFFQCAEAGIGRLLTQREIETVDRAGGGKTRRQAEYGERFHVVPSAQHGVDGAGQEAGRGMPVEPIVEIEPGRNAETVEGGSQNRQVRFGPHHHTDFAKRPARRGLFENAPRNLFGFALDVSGAHHGHGGSGTDARRMLFGKTHAGEAGA